MLAYKCELPVHHLLLLDARLLQDGYHQHNISDILLLVGNQGGWINVGTTVQEFSFPISFDEEPSLSLLGTTNSGYIRATTISPSYFGCNYIGSFSDEKRTRFIAVGK